MNSNGWVLRSAILASLGGSLLALPNLAAAQNAATAGVATLDEIVVTAQKREQRLLDVPLSVNAVDEAQLERQNVYLLTDLSRAVPSVGSNGSIRGITTNGAARSSQGAVAIVLDGVDLGHASPSSSQLGNLFDVARIEVLSGPQGTLFGASASAGVLNVVTNVPSTKAFEVIGRVEAGNQGHEREQLTFNIPLGSTAAVRVGLHNDESKGIVRNTITGAVRESADRGIRARLLWEPSSAITLNLIGDYNRGSGNGQRDIAFAIAPTATLQARLAACGIVASLSNRVNCADGTSSVGDRDIRYGFSAQLDFALGDYTLTSISGYRRHKNSDFNYNGPGGDSDFLSSNILNTNLTPEDYRVISQEVRLASPAGATFEYVAGLYYTDTDQKDKVVQAGGLGLLPPPLQLGRVTNLDITQRAAAVFGQGTYHINDKLSVLAGARYTDEKLTDVSASLTATTTPSLTSLGFLFSPAFFLAPVNQTTKETNFSWKLGVQYQLSNDLMLYANATRGYKGPAVNDQASPPIAIAIVRPEIPMNYEVGLKGAFLGNRLIATAAIFDNKVKDFQTTVYVPPSATSPAGSFAQGNAPYIRARGVDINVTTRPTDDLTLVAGLLYNDAKYSSDFIVACNAASTPGVGGCSSTGTTSPVPRLAAAPEWRFLLNGEYAREVRSGVTAYLQSDVTYESSQFASATPDPVTNIDSHWIMNARVGIRSSDRKWGFSVYGQNLFKTDLSRLSGDFLSGFNGGAGRSYLIIPADTVTYGATIDFRF